MSWRCDASKTFEEKVEWYKEYYERVHGPGRWNYWDYTPEKTVRYENGKDLSQYISDAIKSIMVCECRKKLCEDEKVQEIFMAMFHDTLPISKDIISGWLETHGLGQICGCGGDAFET
ncbi:hypothetical protein D1R32_gp381 [Tunisvirus fontaine2]|uniref:Uncharacterized protein n=1 Tax=Tunisvirus fontaine2 TaxID=1421067 RepID=V9SDY3_9VIRU|nr:hypothetical protein D1R32_gp381 [Tunisvirus fontaine2]AHC55098.1 hypothetical protein TNS_ORF380 [Tunisvirus fontaine2]